MQGDASDAESFYVIDLVDLEQVAAPPTQPAGCTSITTYGARFLVRDHPQLTVSRTD